MRTYRELEARLREARSKALEKAGEKAKDLTLEIIDDVVYGAGTPNEYERTYQLKDSLRDWAVKGYSSSLATLSISHDANLIYSDPDNYTYGSNYYSPTDMSEYVPNMINDGTSGGMFGDGFWMEARPYADQSKEQLSGGKYRKFMSEEIRSMGFRIK